jgi:6,7-dimethyl-8-ribityllumazine synthase
MKRTHDGPALDGRIGKGKRFAVVVSQFNAGLTGSLLRACLMTLGAHGVASNAVRVVRVPGAFELPWAAQRLARSRRYDAVITLGCIIRGRTPHDRYIAHAAAQGVMRVSLDTGVPVIFGVLTTLNERQARARAGRGPANKGREAALTALQTTGLSLKD